MNERDTEVWMRRLEEPSPGKNALPDPALIWWKAQLIERQAAQARVRRPIEFAQWVSLAVAVVATVVLGALNWSAVKGMLEPFGVTLWIPAAAVLILMGLGLRIVFAE